MHFPSPVETETKLSTLIDLLRFRSLNEPSLAAYRFLADEASETITYGELDLRARAVAALLQSRGLQRERVLLLYPPGLEFIAAFFGCLYAGAVAVPASLPQTKRGLSRLQSIATDAQARGALTTRKILARVEGLPLECLTSDDLPEAAQWSEPDNDELAYLQYTSGSTSVPKGVMVTHANVLANSAYIQHGFEHGPTSVSLSWLPHFHDMGLVDGIIQPLYSGFTGLLMSPAALLQNPARWLQAISRYRVTHSGGPNFAYDLCARRIDEAQRASLDLSSWRVAYNGAEPVRHETIERFVEAFAGRGFRREAFYPAYGLAEATLKVTGRRGPIYCNVGTRTLVGCGRATQGTEVAIVNPESLRVCGQDEVGEIWVSGPGVAAGYWNRPEETESTFNVRGRFLRTGDLGLVRDDELFITGRLKDLIIIRGRNHYPQDIEWAVQSSHAALKPDGGAAFSVEIENEERLVVVHESDRHETSAIIEAIREAIAEEFEIQPAAVVLIRSGTLPKTSSGKVRRSACRESFLNHSLHVIAEWRASDERENVTPAAPDELNTESVERWLQRLLTAKLNVAEIDVRQPIARYGIDSLLALELTYAVENGLRVRLSSTSLLRNPTIADLAEEILAGIQLTSADAATDQGDEHALSHGQQALWAIQQVSPESTAYNVAVAARLRGEIDVSALQRAFAMLVQRHSMLRARFPSRDGTPVCVIEDGAQISIHLEDATDQAALRHRLQGEAWTSFDLERGPLLRASLFKRSAREYVLLLSAHHIIVDFWSLSVLIRELTALYEAEIVLPPPRSYADYVRGETAMLAGPDGERLRNYWLQQLAGELPVLDLPTDRGHPAVQSYRGASVSATLDQRLTQQLKQLALRHEATLFMTLLAAFQVLLYRYTGQEDILVGSPSSGRGSAEFAGTIGYFVNPLVLRAKFSGERSFSEFLADTRATALAAFEHQDYPFDLLIKQLQPERDPARSPLFQVMFAFQQGETALKLGDLPVEAIALDHRAAQFDLSLTIVDVDSVLNASFEYNTDLFDAATVERLSEHFRILLESIVADPSVSLSTLPLISNAARRQVLYEWNDTRVDFAPVACVHELFAQRAVDTPDQIAIVSGEVTLTYRELNQRSTRLANYLRARGVGPEVCVGICVPRSPSLLTCVLGVLKAGGAYVPLDPAYPEERLAFMIDDSGASLVLTEELLRAEAATIDGESDADPPPARVDNLAYVIYTSGSTGTPKGVMVQHSSLANYVRAANLVYGVTPEDRVLQFSPFSFDAHAEEIFVCLSSGATLVLRDDGVAKHPLDFLRECSEKRLTVVSLPMPYWHELVAHLTSRDWDAIEHLRLMIIGADKAQWQRVERWRRDVGPRVSLVNTYGPTEATVIATACDLTHDASSVVPIGRPIANVQAYVLDHQLQPTIPGARGELYLGGANITRGYLGHPVLTAEKFIPDPFSLQAGARLYRTGDLARWLSDGRLDFVGRADSQVKIRGHRIEPAEIEAALLRHEAVREAVVIPTDDGSRLAAYISVHPRHPRLRRTELRDFLAGCVPKYMIPSSFTIVDALPRLPSDKIDRRALSQLTADDADAGGSYVGPRTDVERVVCELWAEVLKVDRVGIHDNFFELGGDSILSIQVSARARLAGLKVSPSQIFQHPTPAELGSVVSVSSANGDEGTITGDAPLTPIQRWFFEQEFSSPDHWNMALTLKTRERLDPDLLDQAVAHLVEHHDALRMRFVNAVDGWRQVVADPPANNPLLRATLFADGDLQIVAHHLVVDGVSWRILLEDLARAYGQLQRGEEVSLPARTTSFVRWAKLLHEYAQSESVRSELSDWTSLATKRVKPLPVDFNNGQNVEGNVHTLTVALNAAETQALLRNVYGPQINNVLLTALRDAFTLWTGEQSLLIELEGHGREELFEDVDLSRTVGWFTSAFPVLLEANFTLPRHGIVYGLLRYLNDDAEVTQQMRRLPVPEVSFNYLGQLDQMLSESELFASASESRGQTRHPSAHRNQLLEINAHVSNRQLHVDWNYSTAFHRQHTIEKLAQGFVSALQSIVAACSEPETDDRYPLSPLQQGMLFHSVYAPDSSIYIGQLSFALEGQLDVEVFAEAWRRAIARHAVLRTSFNWEDLDEPLQVVHQQVELPFEQLDWRELPDRDLTSLLEAERRRGFDLSTAPLLRLKLVQLGDESHRLIWTHHHLLLDGWSIAILLREIFADYENLRRGVDTQPSPVREYRDYITWLQQQDAARAESFWRTYLTDFRAPTPLGVDHAPADPAREADLQRLRVRLSTDKTDRLSAFARQQQLTLNTLVQGAWALLLSVYSGEQDVVYGATVSGRPADFDGIEQMVGLFINTLPVRVRVPPEKRVIDWLRQIQADQARAREYEHSPLVELQALSSVPRGAPLFESLLVFENYPLDVHVLGSGESLSASDVWWSDQTNYPLTVVATPGAELSFEIFYDQHRFTNDVAQRMLGHLQSIVENFTVNPSQRLAHVSVVTDDERSVLLSQWNDTRKDGAWLDQTVHELFEAQARKTPKRIALVHGVQQLTYGELNERANRLARYLRRNGVETESRVCICLEPGLNLIVAMLAVLKAGAAYVPLDPAYPDSRLAFMLNDCGARVLLTERRLLDDRVPRESVRAICLDAQHAEIMREAPGDLNVSVYGDNLIYVIYTSGSTGRPKGAGVTHGGFVNLVNWFVSDFELTERERVLIISSFSFDLTQKDLFAPLLIGGELHFPTATVHDPAEIVQTISEAEITLVNCTPSAFYPLIEADGSKLSSLKHIFLGGEPINVSRLREWAKVSAAEILNTYGPTEATDVCSSFRLTDLDQSPPLGKANDNVELLILDEQLNLVPQGVAGELCVGGVGVGRGYVNNPAATAERFVPHPYSVEGGARLYRTGDLVRHLPDGNIEFLSRLDHQVKVAGYRIELGEIEARMVQHRAVRECVVVVRADAHGDARLVAYVVPDERAALPDASTWRRYLADSLPAHMIPSLFVTLEKLPLTPGGKVDRRALPAAETNGNEVGAEYVAPRTAVEEVLAGIWREVLAVERVGVHDNFLDLGGHSLLAMRCIAGIRKVFRVEIPLRVLFESENLGELAQALMTYEDRLGKRVAPGQVIPRRAEGDGAPLSFAQERLWFLDQLEPGGAAYNMPGAVWLEGELNLAALEQSLNEIVRRHEILRTTFRADGGRPVQVIVASLTLSLSILELSDISEARRLAREEAQRPFDLTHGPLLRTTLVRLSADCHLLLVTLHHIVADGWSVTLLVQELGELYAAYCSGTQSPLPELEITYADYAVWQREWLQGERLEAQLAYWREQLRGELPVLKLPLAQARGGDAKRRGALETVRVNRELTAQLRELGKREGATLFMTLLAAWKVLLARLSGEREVVVGTPVAGRVSHELEPLIGFFVNTLVLRTSLEESSFVEVLKRVREVCLEAYAHQEVPFERVVEALRPERELNQAPLFQVLFALQDAPLPQIESHGLRMRVEDATSDTAKFDLTLEITDDADELACVWQYDADVFDATTIKRMAAHYETLLAGIVVDPTCEIHELPLLNQEEERALLTHNNVAYPRQTLLHQLFETQAAMTPNAIAVVSEERSLTYAELNRRADDVAQHLRRLGLPAEGRVGVLLERSTELVVALLGVLKAGGACVPLDPAYPSERLRLLIEDSNADFVLTQEQFKIDFFSRKGAKTQSAAAFPEGLLCVFAPLRERAGPTPIDPANVAYVIYTSGSSGRPKGVMVTHAALCNHMYWMRDAFALADTDVFLQKTPIGFDASVWEFYMPLMVGAKLVMARPGGHQDSAYLVRTITDHGVTVLQVVPTLLRMLVNQAGFSACADLRLVFCGGEALTKELATQCLTTLPSARLCNLYGPAETTIDATYWEATTWTNTPTVPIGTPVANAGAYVLDKGLKPVPIGVVGELYLDGAGLARGYEGRADLTAERFIPNPFRESRMYRTGDLARRLPGGELEFLGRVDGQVKVRGSRVELGEVEAALCAHADVAAAAVTAHADTSGELRLVAYVVATSEPRELRAYLKERLPGHMVPSAFVRLEQLPLLPSGKVDRRALPQTDTFEQTPRGEYRPPRTLIEETLCGIWEEVLGRDRISADDHFFELGGHSLLATQVVSRVKESLSVELPLTRLFQTPVLSELAQFIEQHLRPGDERAEPPLRRVSREQPLPPSFAQQRLWFLDQLEPGNPLYNTPGALRLSGRLDRQALERALSEIVRRHETLRTTFEAVDGNPLQIISPPRPVHIPLIDLSSEVDREREAQKLIDDEAKRPFDLSHGPLLRATLLRLREDEHLLLFTMHHIISDGWSADVLAREAAKFYAAFTGQQTETPAELPLQYADYAVWQREWLRGETLEAQFDYWTRQLDGLSPVLALPLDHPRPKVRSLRGAFVPVEFDEELSRGLKALSRGAGATLFMTLLAAWQTLLSRYSAQDEVAVGVPLANRRRREIEDLIGFFVNTLVMRTNLAGDPTFRELLDRVREVALGAYAHQDVPFEMLVERFQPVRDAAHNPLFNVLFVFQNAPGGPLHLPGLKIEQMNVGTGTAKFDLMLSLAEEDGKLCGILEYSTDLFAATTIGCMLRHFETMLAGVVQNPERRISELPLLSKDEEQQLVRDWNRTSVDFPRASCIQDLFSEQATRTPDAAALISGEERLTYRELDQAANRLAHFLRRDGVGPESVVAVATGRSTSMAVAVLAVLKAGAAYLPLDPEYPHERLSFMLEDAHVSAVLTESHLVQKLPAQCPRVICLDTNVAAESDTNPASGAIAENIAYVIYTSGSTGRPKAVMMSHRAICNFVTFQLTSSSAALRTLQFSSLNFDVSVQEMFTTWCAGATLVLVDEQTRRDAGALLHVVTEHRVERLFLPFVALQHLAEASEVDGIVPRDLREVITAGEQLKITPAIERLFTKLDGCRLDNHYGPTETHLATMWRLEGAAHAWPRLPPIGGPIANAQVYVLDEHYRLVPPGVVGELYIGGEGLARGYFNRPAQTAARFIPNPFSGEAGARLYKTGDLVRRFDEHRLEYVGRSDRQVKVRGFRVEVGEIEATLKLHRDVRQAVVTDWDREDGRKLLVAYVVANGSTSLADLKRLLRDQLPEYMVPAVFVRMDQLPLLPNGKVDRRALPPPDQAAQEDDYVVPRTPVEEVLCAIWEQVLGQVRIGADDDFFEVGGHSLLATQLIARVRQAFRVEVALRSLFEHPTPSRLAQVVEAEMRAGCEPLPPIVRVAHGPTSPLSFAQQRLWIVDKLEPNSAAYNLPVALRLEGPLDDAALSRSFDDLIRRHDVLRTTFAIVEGEPVQVIGPPVSTTLSFIDLSQSSDIEAEGRRLAREEAQRPFDLTSGPLLRTTLVRLSTESHLLLVTLHHIVADGWSMTLLVQELGELYATYCRDKRPALPELEITYADYAVWQREWLQGERLEAQLAYWREQLSGELPVLRLPLAQTRVAEKRRRGALVTMRVNSELTRRLRELGRREGATLFMTLLAAWKVLLARLSDEREVVVGTPVAGRVSRELEPLIGFFVNTLVLRTSLEEANFIEVLKRVREVCLEAYAHQEAPYERVVEALRAKDELFQVLFALQNTPAYDLALAGLKVTVLETDDPAARFDLALEVSETGDELDCRFTYDTDLFDATMITRLAQHFVNLLEAVATDPQQSISAINFLRDDERRQLLFDWNHTQMEVLPQKSGFRPGGGQYRNAIASGWSRVQNDPTLPRYGTDLLRRCFTTFEAKYQMDTLHTLCIHELFEQQVERTPDAMALAFGIERFSYRELNERANQCAHRLRRLGAGPETLIGIAVERSPEMIVGVLGILKAGAAYVPLSPDTPPERLETMLHDAGVELLLTESDLRESDESGENPELNTSAGNLAYVIYTSGSTGRPKGVEVTHRNLVHSTVARFAYYDEPVRSFMLVSPFYFDSSVAGIFWTLCTGGKLVLPPKDAERDPKALAALIEAEQVSHILCLPTVHSLLLRQAKQLDALRCVIVAGESCPPELPQQHFEVLPRASLFNEYGPTEGTVWTTVHRCAPQDRTTPIGRPVANAQTYVLDDYLQPVPVGVVGELYIGGEGVARGYRNEAAQTAARFVPHPHSTEPGARLYATGDLARYLPDGELEFLGRGDQQIKIRGYRIELGEIEAALREHPSVREAVVVKHEDRIVAYLTSVGPTEDVREFLRERLPEYMLPSQIVLLDAMPLNANGKVDRKALPAPGASRPALRAAYAAPQTPLEQTIATVWREFLKLDQVGVNDIFFELGGHSLLLVLVHETLQQRLAREVAIADLFKFPTVRSLAQHLDNSSPKTADASRRAGERRAALKARANARTHK